MAVVVTLLMMLKVPCEMYRTFVYVVAHNQNNMFNWNIH